MKTKLEWKKDGDGDWQLHVDGEYFGLVCPHHLPHYALAVWDWSECQMVKPTVEEAKTHLEHVAIAEKKADEARQKYWESADA